MERFYLKENIKVVSALRAYLDNKLKEHDIVVLEINDSGKKQPFIDVTIYKKDNSIVSTEDCKIVNRTAEVFLDENTSFPNEYRLQVSSPGLDRVLKNEYDWEFALEKEISIQMDAKKGDANIYIGTLENFDNEHICIRKVRKANQTGKKKKKGIKEKDCGVLENNMSLKRNAIKKARLYFDWGGKNNG